MERKIKLKYCEKGGCREINARIFLKRCPMESSRVSLS
jgi:hypothetical protein